jgi:hypothetical protein
MSLAPASLWNYDAETTYHANKQAFSFARELSHMYSLTLIGILPFILPVMSQTPRPIGAAYM